ncbi:MAG: haloacid dehalogenase-like hydrolase [Crenarchaeota archaeon]|nr:haloacid dehalogenase-like hydrolase [Thermoproteota archaeon]
MSRINEALIIDLDNTLVKTNTTFEFMEILCPLRYAVFSRYFKPLLLLNMIFKRDFYKLMMIMICIKGRKKRELECYAKTYYEMIKKNWSKYYSGDVLNLLQTETYKAKVLLTASLDFIANNFKELGFDLVIASKTLYKNERFQSFFDLYGRKSGIVKILSKHFDNILIIDDDPEPAFYTLNKKITVVRFSK